MYHIWPSVGISKKAQQGKSSAFYDEKGLMLCVKCIEGANRHMSCGKVAIRMTFVGFYCFRFFPFGHFCLMCIGVLLVCTSEPYV